MYAVHNDDGQTFWLTAVDPADARAYARFVGAESFGARIVMVEEVAA
jgi:hypothetical protein